MVTSNPANDCYMRFSISKIRQRGSRGVLSFMDETWIARYHRIGKGIGPCGMKLEHSLARGGTRLIVVDAITVDGHLRVECEDKDGHSYVEEALWMYMNEKNDDYHNAFDGDIFKRWIESFYLPAWHAMYPGTPPVLVLDNCPSHCWHDKSPYHAQ